MRWFRSIVVAIISLVICSSCGVSKIADQISVEGLTSLELKGMTGLQIGARVANDSRYNIQMSEAEVTFYHNEKRVVTLTQVGDVVSSAESRAEVMTLWKLSGVNPRSITSLIGQLKVRDIDDITLSYTAQFSVKGLKRRISHENVKLQNFIAIFADSKNDQQDESK